jgi:hypothetical protein
MVAAEETGRYGAPTVWAHGAGRREIARGVPVRDGWLRFKLSDADYRQWLARACLRSSLSTGMLRRSWMCGFAISRVVTDRPDLAAAIAEASCDRGLVPWGTTFGSSFSGPSGLWGYREPPGQFGLAHAG